MGSASVGSFTLQSVVKITRSAKKTVVEHMIPGAPAILQANGRPRDVVKITGILNPTAEITAVQNIAAIGNTAAISVSAVTDVQGTDWAAYASNTYLLQSVEPIESQPGATVPWGHYTITLIELGP